MSACRSDIFLVAFQRTLVFDFQTYPCKFLKAGIAFQYNYILFSIVHSKSRKFRFFWMRKPVTALKPFCCTTCWSNSEKAVKTDINWDSCRSWCFTSFSQRQACECVTRIWLNYDQMLMSQKGQTWHFPEILCHLKHLASVKLSLLGLVSHHLIHSEQQPLYLKNMLLPRILVEQMTVEIQRWDPSHLCISADLSCLSSTAQPVILKVRPHHWLGFCFDLVIGWWPTC